MTKVHYDQSNEERWIAQYSTTEHNKRMKVIRYNLSLRMRKQKSAPHDNLRHYTMQSKTQNASQVTAWL
jgi:hypothetical protein